MKQVKIDIPEGYEIDKDNSTFELIKFKEIKKQLPKSWEELGKVSGFFIGSDSNIVGKELFTATHLNKNHFKTKEQAEASIALAQLSQLRDVYRQGWEPDFSDGDLNKYSISFYEDKIDLDNWVGVDSFLSFQSREIAQEFLNNFKDLIIKAKPLMS